MNKISWFSPGPPPQKEDIEDEEGLKRAVHYAVAEGVLTLYVVREDDPYIGRRLGFTPSSLDDDDEDGLGEEGTIDDIVGSGSEDSSSSSDEDVDEEDEDISSSDSDDDVTKVDDMKYRKFRLGQEYKTIDSFKRAVSRYAVKKRKDLKYHKTDSKRVTAICSDRKCPWRIHASINSSSPRVVVRSLQEDHTCTWQGKVTLLTNARLADLFMDEFRVNPMFSAKQLHERLAKRNINVPWSICERTRLRCLKTFDEEQEEQFARILDYVAELKRTNPGSSVECEVKEGVFNRFYMCFHALKDGWKASCRRILHVDGTHLKWRMKGVLLVACGRDPNDQMFPLAWSIVEIENKPNWKWFMEHLNEDLELGTGNGITIGSDQQKGLIAAVKDVLPFAEHRMCARHVYSNWKKRHSGGALEELFWGAADSYYPLQFERRMKELKEYDPGAHLDLKLSIACPWSRAFFTEYSKCDAVENNLGESFNAAIRNARTKPVVEMLEEIRRRVMVSNDKKRVEAEKVRGDYTPKSVALLEQQIDLAKHCRPLACGNGKYEVGYFNDRFIVQLHNELSCTCRRFLISGIPCCHMASALRLERGVEQDPKKMINAWFKTDKLKRCYLNGMQPVNGMNLWRVTTDVRVKPPPYKHPGGRRKGSSKRKRDKSEGREHGKLPRRGTKMHCSICREQGHNKSNCPNKNAPKPPRRPPGRPRKRILEAESGAGITVSQPEMRPLPLPTEMGSSSQPCQDLPSLSSAFPKRRPGRPRKQHKDYANEEPAPIYMNVGGNTNEVVYDTRPSRLPMEGYGVFTSPVTGDDYVSFGRQTRDTSDNTVLPTYLYSSREKDKIAGNANVEQPQPEEGVADENVELSQPQGQDVEQPQPQAVVDEVVEHPPTQEEHIAVSTDEDTSGTKRVRVTESGVRVRGGARGGARAGARCGGRGGARGGARGGGRGGPRPRTRGFMASIFS